jgi:general secretion pathway protein J
MIRLSFRKSQSWWYATSGMTLIELLVALVIFAVLGVMGYRAASMAMDSHQHLAADMQRWRNIANLLQIVETDLTQFVDRPTFVNGTAVGTSLRLKRIDNGIELSFLKLDGGGGRPARRGYRFDGQQIYQLRWPGTDDVSIPQSYAVLENVAALRFAIVGVDGQRHSVWPDTESGGLTVPAAIDVEMDLPDVGTIRRLVAMQ